MQCSAVEYSAVECSEVWFSEVQFSVVESSEVQCSMPCRLVRCCIENQASCLCGISRILAGRTNRQHTVLCRFHWTVLHRTALCFTELHCTALHCHILHCPVHHYNALYFTGCTAVSYSAEPSLYTEPSTLLGLTKKFNNSPLVIISRQWFLAADTLQCSAVQSSASSVNQLQYTAQYIAVQCCAV